MNAETTRIAFVCVRNAGRSQMATAFAEQELGRRGLCDRVELRTGGTDPADSVHDAVVVSMREVDIDLSDREPREVTTEELAACDVVATMGCSTLDLEPLGDTDLREWSVEDPGGRDLDTVREIRKDVRLHVVALFDELFAERTTT